MGLFKRNKPRGGYYKTFDLGNFIVDLFYDEDDAELCRAEIRSLETNIEFTLHANHEGYGLLMAAAQDDDEASISGYVSLLAICATMLAIDSPFVDIVHNGFKDWSERKMEEARIAADKIMPSDEEASQLIMDAAVLFTELPENEQRAYIQNVINKLEERRENGELDKDE